MISLDPSYGSMLGGTGIIVTITGSMTISEDDQIACIFDGVEVPGIYLNKDKSLCVSPLLAKPGRVVFELIVNHPDQNFVIFTAESVFTSCKLSMCDYNHMHGALYDSYTNILQHVMKFDALLSFKIQLHANLYTGLNSYNTCKSTCR